MGTIIEKIRNKIEEQLKAPFSWTTKGLLKDGKPWLPVMGEFHFSRFPRKYWKEELEKMKAGGVEVVAFYVIWIHHEEIKGEIDWTGDNDIRYFVQLCQEVGLYAFLRPGPWAHAEVRDGGFPDWLQFGPYKIRTNDPAYLAEVKRFWTSMYEQIHDLLFVNGGPIIGIQMENEYGAVGGDGGDAHIRALTALAKEIGYEAPYWTATGWGHAAIGDCLPVSSGYVEAPWDRSLDELGPNDNFIFTSESLGINLGKHIAYDPTKFPQLFAELGGGLQVTYNRRPRVSGTDTAVSSLCKLGAGAGLLGFYVYHGGTNPKGKLSTMQEQKALGNWCDLPELTYDFQAPIREYGQIAPAFHEIRLQAMFLQDFGSKLATMTAQIPEDSCKDASDFETLRYAIRSNGESGYLFVNNYQRRYDLPDQKDITITADGVTFPKFDLKNGEYAFYPFNMTLADGSKLISALATPLCVIGDTTVFYTNGDPQYSWDGTSGKVLTLTRAEALNAYKIDGKLYLCDQPVIANGEGIHVLARKSTEVRVFDGATWETLPITVSDTTMAVTATKFRENYLCQEYRLELTGTPKGQDVFMKIDYKGNFAELFLNGEKVADDYYRGEPWEIGLKRFDFADTWELRVYALEEHAPVFMDEPLPMENGRCMKLDGITLTEEHKILL